MRLVADRIAVTAKLADDLKSSGSVRKADLEEVRTLLGEEQESMEKSARIANTDTYNDQYRRNMSVAVKNSEYVISLLTQAEKAIRRRNADEAATLLQMVVDKRGKKAAQPRNNPMAHLYQEYLIETDAGFHAWLKARGHELPPGAKSVAKTPVKRRTRATSLDGKSNRPEDY
ncbi:hypothetical protein SEA_SANSA_59 [Microbacterium phage Sansa]|uniref:Uncharacterized protein n=1 Tax=Microbacterium phage Sansa TaxID=2250298 RepID=A0A345L030_9CAUD|nr:hypothetical protein SEA_SANSA_59 [Microbacterium phage Sansa]